MQITYLIELFENDSINDKRIEIPLRFNIKFSTKYSYYCLQTCYLKNGYNKSSNTKRKLKNDVDSNILPISKKQKVIDMVDNNEFEINFSNFLNTIFYDRNLVVNYRENIDFFINKYNLRRIKKQGDGSCFINSLLLYHENCLNKILTIEIVKNIYYNYFVMHPIIIPSYIYFWV